MLSEKIHNKSAVIGIIGLGYVGLPLMLRFAEVGYHVVGIDVDESKVKKINRQESYIQHIPTSRMQAVKSNIFASSDFSQAREMDVLILCIPTPLNKYREPDLSYVFKTMDAIAPHLRKDQLISLESTTYPGTTTEELKPRIEKMGLTVGEDIYLVYSPEREDPGNPKYHTATIPKVCGGDSDRCRAMGKALYSNVINEVVMVSSTKAAEMTKLLENIHRSVNIGLVNEMKMVCDKMSINIHEVINAAATKPFGFVPYYPGPGIGGHCIPIDPFYLTWKAREYGLHTRFIELSGEINSSMPQWVIDKLTDALNHQEKPLKNSHILILGLAYKKNVDDVRESPSISIMELLQKKGAHVAYSDPHVPLFPKMRDHQFNQSSIELTAENLNRFDAVILATAHHAFDLDFIATHSHLIIDTRSAYQSSKHKNIVSA